MGDEIQRISARAYAKLNLALAIGPAVDDPASRSHGYHPICSYMHAIELHDTIEIERASSTEYDIAWLSEKGSADPVGWALESDLGVRAHRAMEALAGTALPCAIRVRKAIPAGGGLGGGSSDAASVLLGLNELFGLGLGRERLVSIAMTLGSDIAFFVDPGFTPPRPAIVEGFGERIERLNERREGTEVTLIFPPFGCATGAVYGAFDAVCDRDAPDERPARAFAGESPVGDEMIVNDLFEAACATTPRLREVRDALASGLGRAVHLSGSGSTLFVLGRVEAGRVHEVAPDCRVVHTRLC